MGTNGTVRTFFPAQFPVFGPGSFVNRGPDGSLDYPGNIWDWNNLGDIQPVDEVS